MSSTTYQWYALQLQPRLASVASSVLEAKGHEVFRALYTRAHRWSDRVKEIGHPIFPGYVFCRFDPFDKRVPVLTTPGVLGIVGAGKTPIAVAETEIVAIRKVLDSGLPAQPRSYLGVGTRIYIEDGPLAGLEGIVINEDKVCRLVVSVSLLQRSVVVEIDRDWVQPISRADGCTVPINEKLRSLVRVA